MARAKIIYNPRNKTYYRLVNGRIVGKARRRGRR